MSQPIRQSVVLPATPDRLFDMYLDPTSHAAFTGAPVTIGAEAGSAFSAFNGVLTGHIIETVRPRLIVQAWRSSQFTPEDPDSILVLSFAREGDGGRIDLVHVNVPDQDHDGVNAGWEKYYWIPWRKYLEHASTT